MYGFSSVVVINANSRNSRYSSILFSCGCVGLLTVRLTNPFFKGLGWLGGAFAAGSVGAIMFSVRPDVSVGPAVIIPNTFILLAYVFLQAGILEITESASFVPKLGIFLLAAQVAAYPVFRSFHNVEQLCVVTLGLLLAVQAIQSATLLKRHAKGGMRPPIWFSVTLLERVSKTFSKRDPEASDVKEGAVGRE